MVFDPDAPETTPASSPSLTRDGPDVKALMARHRPFFILVGVLVVQLLMLSFQITRNHNVRLIRIWAVNVFDPFERSLRGLANATTRAWRGYRGLWRAQEENLKLRVQLVAAQSKIQDLAEQTAELPRLRSLLEFKSRLPFSTVAAEVIGTSPGENSSAVFIDKGTDAGLTPDLAVITPEGVVGKTIAVFRHTSQVLLITDPSSGLAAMLERSRIQGILKGSDGTVAKLQYVMNEESVAAGQAVLSSGLDQICPKGLPLGTVIRVGEGNIYKNIVVKPTAPLNRLEAVLVVLKPTSTEQQALNTPLSH